MPDKPAKAKAPTTVWSSTPALTTNSTDQHGPPSKSSSVSGPASGTKVNQAVFIHKLYSMLEDDSIKHLIAWTPSNDSFVISPGEEFSKVLSQYFKHTNPSSFVRQLNMYGFHKVNDTFHGSNSTNSSLQPNPNSSNNSSDTTAAQWEFKHGTGSFKRGDVEALGAIKRRTSRPSAIHRDSVSLKPVSLSVPSTPPADYATPPPGGSNMPVSSSAVSNSSAMPLQHGNSLSQGQPHSQPYLPQHHSVPYYPPPDTSFDARLASLENSIWTLRSSYSILQSKYNNLVEYCKHAQTDGIQVVDTLAKLVTFIDHSNSPSKKIIKTEAEITPSNINFELNQIRSRLNIHSKAISQLVVEDQPLYLTQYPPPSSYSFSQHQPQHQPPHHQQQPYHIHPHTKSEISFASSSRDRAGSVFYDPLAPAPQNPGSPRQQIEDNSKGIPTSAPQLGPNFHLHRQSAPGGLPHQSQRGSPANSTPSSPTPRHAEPYSSMPVHYQQQQQQQPQYGQQPPHQQHQQPPLSQPQSPQPHLSAPTSVPPVSHYYGEAPASPQGSTQTVPPPRDQRPGSFPFVSSYHSQRQQLYMGGPLAPSSNAYGPPMSSGSNPANGIMALNSASKLRSEAMAPFRRHTSSELLVNMGNTSTGMSAPISMTTPPDSSSRHNSCASSNSSSSGSALKFTVNPVSGGGNVNNNVNNSGSTSSPFSHSSPRKKVVQAPTLTVEPPPGESSNVPPILSQEHQQSAVSSGASLPTAQSNRSGGSSVQSLLNPTTSSSAEEPVKNNNSNNDDNSTKDHIKTENDNNIDQQQRQSRPDIEPRNSPDTSSDIEPERKRLKVV